ncbi:MAG: serine/threonine protein kinase [Pseudomonadota bacterium]
MASFTSKTVMKSDVFSQTHAGYFDADPDKRVIRRIVTASPIWTRPLAWFLAKREIRALKKVSGIVGVPQLLETDHDGLFRSWTDGTPLHLAAPMEIHWYRDAHRILKEMRNQGVTHNDLAKPQNWLMTPDGDAAVIDFQLASSHRNPRSKIARTMAYEDLRHLLKQKKAFAPKLLTPIERRILKRKSLPSRIWLATGKKVYNFITRRVLKWSDGEGTGDRLTLEGPAIIEDLSARSDVEGHSLLTYSLPSKGVGLYLFVETEADEGDIRKYLKNHRIEHIQTVHKLPRKSDGGVRMDVLHVIAHNQMTELDELLAAEPDINELVEGLVAGRKNFTDRRITS